MLPARPTSSAIRKISGARWAAGAALSVNTWGNGVTHLHSEGLRHSLYALRLVEARANLLRASNVLDQAALDKYTFTRDVYLQLRGDAAFDGDAYDPNSEPAPAR